MFLFAILLGRHRAWSTLPRGDIDTCAPFYPGLNAAEQGELASTSA